MDATYESQHVQSGLNRQSEESVAPVASQHHHPISEASRPKNVGRMERYLSLGIGAALALSGLSRGKMSGLLLLAGGGALLYRGATGHCYGYEALGIDTASHSDSSVIPAQQGQWAEKSVAVNRSPEELFTYWRNLENLPDVMPHLKRVTVENSERSHWVAEGPFGSELHWDAEIFNERENELIAWRSLPGGDIDTAGSVHFKSLGHDRGTEVKVTMKYNPPGGKMGAMIAFLSGYGLQGELTEDLRNFKRKLETGELATAEARVPH
jgi:uncharacterized membrane protein